MILGTAYTIAVGIAKQLKPYCDEIKIAGSIRRWQPEVKDIEIVCVPKHEVVDVDLFGEATERRRDFCFLAIVNSLGAIVKGNATDGRYMQIMLPEGIALDLFMPQPHDFWRQLAIRTGSADWVRENIAGRWSKMHWVGTEQGLRKRKDCVQVNPEGQPNKWKCTNPNAELPPVWTSEQEFFEWLNIPYVEPKYRELIHHTGS